MAESRDHRRLVSRLARRMQLSGVRVAMADAGGWPRPGTIGRRRPDVIGHYGDGSVVIGEAKRGPELWQAESQLRDLAYALREIGPYGTAGVMVLGVGTGWGPEATSICSTIDWGRATAVVWELGG